MKRIGELFSVHSDDLMHLDLLRFIASCGIVFHHSKEFFFDRAVRAAASAQTHALSMFVDLFFIISGFVIAYAYHHKVSTVGEFRSYLHRRLARLLPLHWLTFAIAAAVYALIGATGLKMQHTIPFDPLCMTSTMVLVHSFVGCAPGEVFNGVSWSLSAEMVMYVAFPVLSLVAARLGRAALAGGAAFSAAFFVTFIAFYGVGFTAYQWAEILPPLRALPAFFFGVCLFVGRGIASRIPAARLLFWLVLAFLTLAMLSGAPAAVVLVLTYVTVIAAVSADQQHLAGAVVRGLAPLGQLTYSMYLIHPIFILVLMNGLGDKVLKLNTNGMAALALLCYALIAIASYLSLTRFEGPARVLVGRLGLGKLRGAPAPGRT